MAKVAPLLAIGISISLIIALPVLWLMGSDDIVLLFRFIIIVPFVLWWGIMQLKSIRNKDNG